jgi:hypothetical protein
MPVESTNDSSETHPPASASVPDGDGNGSAVSSRTLTFRKFRELLMVKQFSERDNIPVKTSPRPHALLLALWSSHSSQPLLVDARASGSSIYRLAGRGFESGGT